LITFRRAAPAEDYQDRLEAHGITCSMTRTGNCYQRGDGSPFSTVKIELADRFDSHGQAIRELFDYIEGFYNTRRRPSTLDYVSPAAFERRFRTGAGQACA
jgi:putative transposase